MRNVEQIEMALTQLQGKQVILIVPMDKKMSMSLTGPLEVISNDEHSCGFHVSNPVGGWAMIFFAENVLCLDEPKTDGYAKIIRLLTA